MIQLLFLIIGLLSGTAMVWSIITKEAPWWLKILGVIGAIVTGFAIARLFPGFLY